MIEVLFNIKVKVKEVSMFKVVIGVLALLLLPNGADLYQLRVVGYIEIEIAKTQGYAGHYANQTEERLNAQASADRQIQSVCNAFGKSALVLFGIVSHDYTITDPELLNSVEEVAESWRYYCAPDERPIRMPHRVVR